MGSTAANLNTKRQGKGMMRYLAFNACSRIECKVREVHQSQYLLNNAEDIFVLTDQISAFHQMGLCVLTLEKNDLLFPVMLLTLDYQSGGKIF